MIEPSYLAPGSGKANATFRWIAENSSHIPVPDKSRAAVGVYVISREEIESLDTLRFTKTFSPRLSKRRLRQIQGRILFAVNGYDDSPFDIFEIEEVRRYFRHLHRVWPCWLFASSILSTNLRALALCILPNLQVHRTHEECRIRFPQEDLLAFFESCLPATALLHDRSGIDKLAGLSLLKNVADHLGVPEN